MAAFTERPMAGTELHLAAAKWDELTTALLENMRQLEVEELALLRARVDRVRTRDGGETIDTVANLLTAMIREALDGAELVVSATA